MKNVVINGVTYNSVPSVHVPISGGGTAEFLDTTIDTNGADASKILSGYKGYVHGSLITGNLTTPTVSQDSTTKILTIS